MGLYICVLGSEHLLGTIDSSLFHDVSKLASTVISFTRIAFCVFIRKDRSHGLKHSLGNEIFRCDQFQSVSLAAHLVVNSGTDNGIDLRDIGGKKIVGVHMSIFWNSASSITLTPRLSALVNFEPES